MKPEFWSSEQIAECSRDARLLFIGMWNFCDDSGVIPASLKGIKMKVFPGDEDVDSVSIRRMVDELLANELIEEYSVENKGFWRVIGWKHQKIDQPTFKYPLPNGHIPSNVRRTNDEHSPPEGNGREGNGKKKEEEQSVVFSLPTNTGEEYGVEEAYFNECVRLYPAVDVMQELRSMRGWLDANRERRKTRRGMKRFVNGWLSRAQDRPRGNGNGSHQQAHKQSVSERATAARRQFEATYEGDG